MTTSSDLNAGRIVGVFGVRGECKIDATRVGAGALGVGTLVALRLPDGTRRELRIRSARMHKGRPLAAFEGYDSIEAVQPLVGGTLALDRSDVVLGAGEYLDTDLIGCTVADAGGAPLGAVVGIEHYPAQDMLVVGPERALIPMVAAFVKAVDIDRKRIIVDLPPGLLNERDADQA